MQQAYYEVDKKKIELIGAQLHETKISNIIFEGNEVFSDRKLANQFKENKDFRTSQGIALKFSLDSNAPNSFYRPVESIGYHWVKNEVLAESGRERLLNFGKNYWVPQFSVHRTDEFCEDSEQYGNISDKTFGELIHSFMFICRGKSAFVDCLYLIRQKHSVRYLMPNKFDWIIGPEWHSSFKTFHNALTDALTHIDMIPKEKASEAVKRAFWIYLSRVLYQENNLKSTETKVNSREFVTKFVKRIPGAKKLWYALTAQKTDKWSPYFPLEDLLSPSSNLNKEFMPVYEAITKQPVTTQ